MMKKPADTQRRFFYFTLVCFSVDLALYPRSLSAPPLGHQWRREYLGERVGNGVNMISISVDPTIDTPDVLKKYAE